MPNTGADQGVGEAVPRAGNWEGRRSMEAEGAEEERTSIPVTPWAAPEQVGRPDRIAQEEEEGEGHQESPAWTAPRCKAEGVAELPRPAWQETGAMAG